MGVVANGCTITTGDENYRYKGGVSKETLKKIIDLLDIPQKDRAKLTADKIRTILVVGPKPE